MEKDCILAFDIGTSGVKASLVLRHGDVLDSTYHGYLTRHQPGFVEQDPQDWWHATLSCLTELTQRQPEYPPQAIVMSGQMQDVILCDAQGHLAPAILYSDTRAAAEIAVVQNRLGEMRLRQVTGNLQDAASLLAKLLWVKNHWREVYEKAQVLFMGAHDYVTWRLCGAQVTDWTTASTTGLLDLNSNAWAYDFLDALELRKDWLPTLTAADQPVGRLDEALAKLTNLPQGIPIYHGAGDAATTTLGAGAGEAGRLYIYLGTSGWLATTTMFDPVDPTSGVFNLRHVNAEKLILIGPMLTAAGNLEWLREQFGDLEVLGAKQTGLDAYQQITSLAEQVPPGCEGVLYLPYLAGERAPFRDPHARGVFFGLSRSTLRFHLYRAVLEGVAFGMKTIYHTLPESAQQQSDRGIRVAGGGARSRLWTQIIADVFNRRVELLANPGDVAVRGAALIAARALGWYSDYDPPAYFPAEQICEPQTEAVERYGRLYEVFRDLYPTLKPSFERLATSHAHEAVDKEETRLRTL